MKLATRCPRCLGTVAVTIRQAQRTDADTILANAVAIHTESCPSPPPRAEPKRKIAA